MLYVATRKSILFGLLDQEHLSTRLAGGGVGRTRRLLVGRKVPLLANRREEAARWPVQASDLMHSKRRRRAWRWHPGFATFPATTGLAARELSSSDAKAKLARLARVSMKVREAFLCVIQSMRSPAPPPLLVDWLLPAWVGQAIPHRQTVAANGAIPAAERTRLGPCGGPCDGHEGGFFQVKCEYSS